ncbi:helix-turn-helix domain-containing protein [Alkalihalobacterium bogoriense]|uniref:helix-turn-helix domain-containing protein n=1 Tax=Alkalihalobacterium bogoriense TaxID=246272 RepID=UPI00047CC472|nr:helix-turn-helix domain-containing protein [Alkalihalobacterium bogoriense]
MNQDEFTQLITRKMKLVRTEMNYTQEKMATVLGISKKTLVQIEKERLTAGWTVSVCLCALFRHSDVLHSTLGGDPVEIMETIAHDRVIYRKERTMGGKVWWREIKKQGKYKLQQNIISQHYRILDEEEYRLYSTFQKEEAHACLDELSEQK